MAIRTLPLCAAALALTALTACDELTLGVDSDTGDATDVGIDAPDIEGDTIGDTGVDPRDTAACADGDASDGSGGDTDVGIPPEDASAVNVRFEPEGDGFYRMPWPSDLRTHPDGRPVLSDLPAGATGAAKFFASRVEAMVHGFALAPTIYVALEADPIPATPIDPRSSLCVDGPVQLIDVSPEGCGRRTPIEVYVNHRVDRYMEDNLLVASTVPGFVLEPGRPHALIVLRTLGEADGNALAASPLVQDALAGTAADPRLNEVYAPLADCLPELGFGADAIAVATVFTTQDPATEMQALRDEVADPERTESPQVTWNGYSDDHSRASRRVYTGTYETPIFQDGTSPYNTATDGGLIHFDEDGRPVRQRWETVPMTVVAPGEDAIVQPPYDLAIWVDGTGAGDTSWVGSSVTRALNEAGFIVAGYTPQFHGSRATPGSNEELHSFNVVNPDSFRNTFRQQVADTAYFLRVMTEARDQMSDLPAVDDSRIVYAGQSQGSMIGTMVAGVEPRIEAYVFNGVAAYLATTAAWRVIDFNGADVPLPEVIANFVGIPLGFDHTHLFMTILQTGAEASDPHSFAARWRGWDANPDGADVLLINGLDDHTAALEAMNAIAIAGNVDLVAPAGWDPDPFEVWNGGEASAPISGNRTALDGTLRTHIAIQDATTGHFTIYDREETRERAVAFLRSAADGQAEFR